MISVLKQRLLVRTRSTYFEFVTSAEVVAVEGASCSDRRLDVRVLDEGNVGLAGDGLYVDVAGVSIRIESKEHEGTIENVSTQSMTWPWP